MYHKVLSVGDYSEDHMFDAIEAVLTASSMTKKKVRERVTNYCPVYSTLTLILRKFTHFGFRSLSLVAIRHRVWMAT